MAVLYDSPVSGNCYKVGSSSRTSEFPWSENGRRR